MASPCSEPTRSMCPMQIPFSKKLNVSLYIISNLSVFIMPFRVCTGISLKRLKGDLAVDGQPVVNLQGIDEMCLLC
jgi:hypothetical protein